MSFGDWNRAYDCVLFAVYGMKNEQLRKWPDTSW
jgi:hypothetical protein